ncbi:MAG: hypothetical protein Q8P84_05705 [Deltaproteobacteria bacterium]|nr:hypothetical protein [Deltaproteobacteria bacterium]
MNPKLRLFSKFASFGVVARGEVKNDLPLVRGLIKERLLKKVYKKGCVFYELTEKALPLLEEYRHKLLAEARLQYHLYPRRRQFYGPLLEDVRFLDDAAPDAEDFRFLGDWRLQEPPLPAQLELSQWRFYHERGLD